MRRLGFLTIGLFDPDDPGPGHEATLQLIELGEELGLDSAWLRHRHLQHGISSPLPVLAAASQRTRHIELGTAVTPLAWENPLRLAEELATVDVLSGGRLNPGLSVGPPMRWDDVRSALYPDTAEAEDFSYERVLRLLRHLRGEPASSFEGVVGIETFSRQVQPQAAGLAERVWYGAGSVRSATWAGSQGLNLLTSSVLTSAPAEGPWDFAELQATQIEAYRAAHPAGPDRRRARVSQGLVVIPTDSASPAQRRRYEDYAASRFARTREPQGPGRLLFAPDLVGPSDELAERLAAHAAYRLVDEVAFALPFTFTADDHAQILTDLAHRLGPALGWSPRHRPAPTTGGAVADLLSRARGDDVRVEPADLAAAVAAGALVVDTRPVEQRERDGELPAELGALVVDRTVLEWRLDPTSPDRLPEADSDGPGGRRVIVVCHEGYSSSLAAESLRRLGVGRATDLVGGFEAWRAWRGAGAGSDEARGETTGS